MNVIEKRIQELFHYKPEQTKQDDLDEFWTGTLLEVHDDQWFTKRIEKETLLQNVKVYDVTFNGFKNTPIHGLFIRPSHGAEGKKQDSDVGAHHEKYPCVIIFPGYHAVKLGPEHYIEWIAMGIAVFVVDIRGQSNGNTLGSSHGMVKGWMTENILNIQESYYKALTVDNLRAVRWVLEQEDIDVENVGVYGGSQGGGLALMAATFFPQLKAAVADIPNLCHVDFGVFHSQSSLSEVAEFCRKFGVDWKDVLKNLSYFDHLNLADRIKLPVMLSVGLKDNICMPETIFPVYNLISSEEKSLEIYPFTAHTVEESQRQKGYQFMYKHLNDLK